MRWLMVALTMTACGPVPSIEKTTFSEGLNVDLSQSTRQDNGLYTRDLTEGTGAVAKTGNMVTMRYTGWLADGTQFDSSQQRGFQFKLGAGDVIAGWDLGVPGMKVGGTRQLIIPPGLGYGASGNGPIPGNAILVFSVTMVSTP